MNQPHYNDQDEPKEIIPKTNILSIFNKVAKNRGMTVALSATNVCQKYREIAPTILGQQILNHTFPKFFKDNTLAIAVENSAWAQEVYMNKTELMAEINKNLSGKKVESIQIITEAQKIT